MHQNLLFICSRNQWRSPTAEKIYSRDERVNVRSAGTSPKAKKTINANDIKWADIIFVMEYKHRDRLKASFPRLLQYKHMVVLDIPDDYQYMDQALIECLIGVIEAYL
ncbi:MAG: Cellular communication/signal transduction [uncultured Sulfurovum sp.]|uniref:Cellular communication/signal transduction n=1 Tax=uncultured Sulfurovum sp. TaxID=269237 RepID=A0A6S6U194_9BACT|nr:MAG: Cellular communication/signal transduction [uncultured Sulfurovum sp.]